MQSVFFVIRFHSFVAILSLPVPIFIMSIWPIFFLFVRIIKLIIKTIFIENNIILPIIIFLN